MKVPALSNNNRSPGRPLSTDRISPRTANEIVMHGPENSNQQPSPAAAAPTTAQQQYAVSQQLSSVSAAAAATMTQAASHQPHISAALQQSHAAAQPPPDAAVGEKPVECAVAAKLPIDMPQPPPVIVHVDGTHFKILKCVCECISIVLLYSEVQWLRNCACTYHL